MRIVIQRVGHAGVEIDRAEKRAIGRGLVLLVGICGGDDEATAVFMAEKAAHLRIFSDEGGAMNRSLLDVGGAALVVSNFTLYADCKKGRRPSFTAAAGPDTAEPLYERFAAAVKGAGVRDVQTGVFGADMQIDLVNDGPVTIILDSAEIMPKRV